MNTIKQITEENGKGIHSMFNACMHKAECRSKDDEIESLKRQLEGERAAALNYRNDAIEAGKKCDGLLSALEEAKQSAGNPERVYQITKAAIASAKGAVCKTCNGEGGWESAASSTSYFWKDCPDCVKTKGGA